MRRLLASLAIILSLCVPASTQFNNCAPGFCNPAVTAVANQLSLTFSPTQTYVYNATTTSSFPTFLTNAGATFARNSIGYDLAATTQVPIDTARIFPATDGFLYEPAATNLFTNSQSFSTNWGSPSIGITAIDNVVVAPDGTTTGSTANSVTGSGQLRQFFGAPTVGNYAISIFAKFVSGNPNYSFSDQGSNPGSGGVNFNASTQVTSSNGAATASGKTTAGNGWTRYYAIYSVVSGNAFPTLFSNGIALVDIYGAQWEIIGAKTAPTSYFPTVTTSATRGADLLTIPVPSGLSTLTITYMDNTTQVITGATGTYALPTSINESTIKSMIWSMLLAPALMPDLVPDNDNYLPMRAVA